MSLSCQCSNPRILLTFYSNDTNYGSESFFQTATLVTSKIPQPSALDAIVSILIFFILKFFLVFSWFACAGCDVENIRKEASETREITKKPTIVQWIGELGRMNVRYAEGVRFEWSNYVKQYDSTRKEESQRALDWVEKIINQTYGDTSRWPQISVPRSARIISVPMKNFKCGETCTEFKPNCDVSPEDAANSYYTYQMCGQNRIQVVRYVENGVTYVAGYCVYIPRPYEFDCYYNEIHIQNCYQGPQYSPKSDPVSRKNEIEANATSAPKTQPEVDASETTSLLEIPLEDPKESEGESNLECDTKDLRNFKLHFCEIKKDIVAIGCVDGLVKHFNWNIFSKSYESGDCETCKLVEWEESPPPYHMLNIWTEDDV